MWIAALGTVDERMPGGRIPWSRFLFNRGMFVLVYGIPSLFLGLINLKPGQANWYLALAAVVLLIVALNDGLVSVALSLLQDYEFLPNGEDCSCRKLGLATSRCQSSGT